MQALILAGGSGTRFWPLSRRSRPKQLLALDGETTLLQTTVGRLAPLVDAADVWVCTTRQLAGQVGEQLPEVPADQILSEPTGRNTAAAIGWSIQSMLAAGTDDVVAVLPADHRMAAEEAFRETLTAAADAVRDRGCIMTLGIRPRWAETGYGYLELGESLDEATGLTHVARFVEKPDAQRAEEYLAGGRHLWNAGIFVFRASSLLAALERFEPELHRGLAEIAARPDDIDALYPNLPATSIDYAVMERLDDLATLPLDCGWSDLGSWEALAEVLPKDEAGNAARGDVIVEDAGGNLLVADEGTIAALGVRDLVVVRTGSTVLVIPKARSQEVRRIVDRLRSAGRSELL